MDETTPEDGFSNVDFIRQRWASMGLDRSEAAVQAAAKAMDEEDARQLNEQAQAVLIPEESTREFGNSRTPESPDEDLDDAWRQHDEEKAAEHAQDRPTPEREPVTNDSVDDIYQSLRDEYCTEPAEPIPSPAAELQQPEPELTRAPKPAPSPVVKAIEAAVKQHRPRKPTPARKLPHGTCTGVWIPKAVYEDPGFESFNEMILYLEINHLDQENGCTAKNKHFADYLGCNVQTVQDMIRSMTKRGIFLCVYPSRTSRIIHIAGAGRVIPGTEASVWCVKLRLSLCKLSFSGM